MILFQAFFLDCCRHIQICENMEPILIWISIFCTNRSTSSANGCALIFVYMTYTMLPVRLREALFGGLLLSAVHIYLSCLHSIVVDWLEVIFKTHKKLMTKSYHHCLKFQTKSGLMHQRTSFVLLNTKLNFWIFFHFG